MADFQTRVYTDGEVLASRDLNRTVTDALEELAGRRGEVELESSLSVPDEGLTVSRTSSRDANPALGATHWTDSSSLEVWNGIEWLELLTTRLVTAATLRSNGDVTLTLVPSPTQVASGFHRHYAPGTPARPAAQQELPPLQFYQSAPAPPGAAPPQFSLGGGSFVALAWGSDLEIWRDSTFLKAGSPVVVAQGYYRDPFSLSLRGQGELVVWLLT